jgi:hypothetical protein
VRVIRPDRSGTLPIWRLPARVTTFWSDYRGSSPNLRFDRDQGAIRKEQPKELGNRYATRQDLMDQVGMPPRTCTQLPVAKIMWLFGGTYSDRDARIGSIRLAA